jgi:hypothetical protein
VATVGEATDQRWAPEAVRTLAEAWAGEGERVFLMDLDVEQASLSRDLGLDESEGVSDLIRYGASIPHVTSRPEGSSFLFASAGTPVASSPDVLDSARWPDIVGAFRDTGVTLVLHLPLRGPGFESLEPLVTHSILLGSEEDAREALESGFPGDLLGVFGILTRTAVGPDESAPVVQPTPPGESGPDDQESDVLRKRVEAIRARGEAAKAPGVPKRRGRGVLWVIAVLALLAVVVWLAQDLGIIDIPWLPGPGSSGDAEAGEYLTEGTRILGNALNPGGDLA